jgi:hypothetical protein
VQLCEVSNKAINRYGIASTIVVALPLEVFFVFIVIAITIHGKRAFVPTFILIEILPMDINKIE